MKKIILILICFAFANYSLDAQRKVAWVHGLGGSPDSWNVYEGHYTNQYNLNSLSIGYAMNGIKNGGIKLKNTLKSNWGAGSQNNIIIAHSMGGLVTRSVDQNSEDLYGGFITVGSPHGGAPLSAAFNNGALQDYVNEACLELTKGPDKALACLLGGYYTTPKFLFGLTNQTLCNIAWDAAIKRFGHFNNQSSQDLAPGSPFLESLTDNSDAVRLGFHGIESDNIHWRVFTSLVKNNPSKLSMNQTKDGDYVQAANSALNFYRTTSDILHFTATMMYLNPFGWFGNAACYRDAAFKFSDGAAWIDRSEGGWIKLIGAGTMTQSGTTTRFVGLDCDGDGKADNQDGPPRPPEEGECSTMCHPVYETVPRYVYTTEGSDGIVPVSRAQLPGAVANLDVAAANHQELLNHPSMTARFNQTFAGTFDNFFIID